MSASDWRKDKPKRREWRRRGPARTDQGMHEFTVQKPYCSPARGVILAALENYGPSVHDYQEYTREASLGHMFDLAKIPGDDGLADALNRMTVPMVQEAKFKVPRQIAGWAEYLMWSSGNLVVVGGVVDPKNRERGLRRRGRMPTPWYPRPGEAAIEPGCKEGHAAWQRAAALIEQAKKGRR